LYEEIAKILPTLSSALTTAIFCLTALQQQDYFSASKKLATRSIGFQATIAKSLSKFIAIKRSLTDLISFEKAFASTAKCRRVSTSPVQFPFATGVV
jgi:hypothetical protein